MTTKNFLRNAVCAALLTTGLAAQAGTMTFNGAYHGNYNNVAVVTPMSYTGGAAGGFAVSLSGFAEFGGTLNGAFESYCVDLAETIGTASSYSILTASSYFSDPAKATALGKLISYIYGSNVFGAAADKDRQSTALQLAVWNIVYDTDSTLASGAMRETTTNFRSSAGAFQGSDALLANSLAYTGGPAYELFVLSSGRPIVTATGKQDQLIWRQASVPEPASLALVGLALGAAGLARRRCRA